MQEREKQRFAYTFRMIADHLVKHRNQKILDESWEFMDSDSVLENAMDDDDFPPDLFEIICILQTIHDDIPAVDWIDRLKNIAERYRIIWEPRTEKPS